MGMHVRRVTESSNGQKTVTIPKDADIGDGDYVKLKKTDEWDDEELSEAVTQALDDLDEKVASDDPLEPDGIRQYSYLCGFQPETGWEPCALQFNSVENLEDHFAEVHDKPFDAEEHIIELVRIETGWLPPLVKKVIRYLDAENNAEGDTR